MRFPLSVILIVGSTALFCHGWFNAEKADALLASGGIAELYQLQQELPYTFAVSQARERAVETLTQAGGNVPSWDSVFAHAWTMVEDRGFGESLPFVKPHGLALIGLCALLLALIMPGTRFRGMALLFLLLGAVACWPAFLDPGRLKSYVEFFDPVRYAYAWFPQIAVGLTFMGGLLLGARRGPRVRED